MGKPRAQDRRHLFVTPWCALKANSEYTYINQSPFNIRSIHGRPVQCCAILWFAMLIILCVEAFLLARYNLLFISNKFSNGIGPETLQRYLFTPRSWTLNHLYVHLWFIRPLCVMIFDASRSITLESGRGLSPGNREFFGPCEMASSRYASAIWDPRNVSAPSKIVLTGPYQSYRCINS